MPPTTTMQTFLQALRTGRTNVTDSLERLFASPIVLQRNGHLPEFQTRGHLDNLDPECQALLGVTPADVAHINDWPNYLKEDLRARLVDAIASGQAVHFRWKVSTGNAEAHAVKAAASGEITITFQTPESKVRAAATDDVAISAGPSGPPTL